MADFKEINFKVFLFNENRVGLLSSRVAMLESRQYQLNILALLPVKLLLFYSQNIHVFHIIHLIIPILKYYFI